MAESVEPTRRLPLMSPAQWVIIALLATIAAILAANLVFSPDSAGAQTGSADPSGGGSAGSGKGLFAVAGQLTRDTYGLYLLDNENGTICVYEYLGNVRKLRLVAARTFVYDRQLDSYNTEPTPKDVAKLVAEARRLREVTPKP